MSKAIHLNEKWIKASVIGTTWAASEIVLGSFLHNLKIPFSGNILTAIAIILLISASYIWKEKGLFWRAGIICAIMKTMSPSAVVFGPMIAIFSQSMLLEISTRLLGRTYAGFIIGAMLAMSWNLVQKIVNFIIFYGMNVVEIYESLIQLAQKQLHLQFDILWVPIAILFSIYAILGFSAAILGIRIGKRVSTNPVEYIPLKSNSNLFNFHGSKNDFKYSFSWLFVNIVLFIIGLYLIHTLIWYKWVIGITIIASIWSYRYKRALKQLMKPKFWFFFAVITMSAAFIFSKVQGESIENGLLIGLQMNFRAILVIIGFTVLGTELYNPKIQQFLFKSSFKQLAIALEISFETLPLMISVIPDTKTFLKNPLHVLATVISQIEFRLEEIKKKQNFKQQVFIITGKVEEGKTSTIINLITNLKNENITIGGIFAPRIMEETKTIGYDIISIIDDKRSVFLRENSQQGKQTIGKFELYQKGLDFGNTVLNPIANTSNDLIIIDEIGKLELKDKGWNTNLHQLINYNNNHLVLTVRDIFVEEILKKYNIKNFMIYDISKTSIEEISNSILEKITTN